LDPEYEITLGKRILRLVYAKIAKKWTLKKFSPGIGIGIILVLVLLRQYWYWYWYCYGGIGDKPGPSDPAEPSEACAPAAVCPAVCWYATPAERGHSRRYDVSTDAC
jgi:hypothetical protein